MSAMTIFVVPFWTAIVEIVVVDETVVSWLFEVIVTHPLRSATPTDLEWQREWEEELGESGLIDVGGMIQGWKKWKVVLVFAVWHGFFFRAHEEIGFFFKYEHS